MFGFGLSKLLVLVLIVGAVWYGFKLIGRLDRQRKQKLSEKDEKPTDSIGEMEKCPVCSTYVVAAKAANCGRPGCPY